MRTLLKKARVVSSAKQRAADVLIQDGVIARIAPPGALVGIDARSIDLNGSLLVPGYIDSHVHGVGGMEFDGDPEALIRMARIFAQYGVTAFCATTTPGPNTDYARLLERYQDIRMPPGCARFLGVHLEGPFVNPARKGAIREEAIRPISKSELDSVRRAGQGILRVITLAPELPGAQAAIEGFAKDGVVVSLGHSAADCETAMEAVRWGASRVTHTFNAMPGLRHRQAGLLSAAMLCDQLDTELISDMVHVGVEAARILFKLKGPRRVICVSDGLKQSLCPDAPRDDGQYIQDGCLRDPDGTLYGSLLLLSEHWRRLIGIGLEPTHCVAALSANCARNLGLRLGDIKPGYPADLNVLDGGFGVQRTMIGGCWVAGE